MLFVAFNIYSLSLIFVSFINMSQRVPPWVYLVQDSLHFLDLSVSFLMLGKFSAIISSDILSGPFSLSLLLLGPL